MGNGTEYEIAWKEGAKPVGESKTSKKEIHDTNQANRWVFYKMMLTPG